MFELRISTRAEKQIKKIKKAYQSAILLALEDIREDPLIGKPLSRELTARFSYRVGMYRIIYKVKKKDKVVEILSAGHRATIYN